MSNWPENDVWEPKDAFNRAPRPALIECTPSRCVSAVRILKALTNFLACGAVCLFLLIVVAVLVHGFAH